MAFNAQASSHRSHYSPSSRMASSTEPPQFDILDWYPQFQSCHRYFLDHAQHSGPVLALAAFINIQLPFQKQPHPVLSSSASSPPPNQRNPYPQTSPHAQSISLVPYIRRLVATGHDTPAVLHGFFGDDWARGIGSLHEIERRNYLFAAKSTSWLKVKQSYDLGDGETIPFLSPLKDASEKEILQAEKCWSEWLAMQDWMLGPRAPELQVVGRGGRVKREGSD